MSSFANAHLANGQVAVTQSPLFTATAVTLVKSLQLANPGAPTQTTLLWRQHGAAAPRLIRRVQLAQYETADVIEGGQSIELDIGDSILAQCGTAAAVDFILDGVLIT